MHQAGGSPAPGQPSRTAGAQAKLQNTGKDASELDTEDAGSPLISVLGELSRQNPDS
jgi:hypothetical protein